MRSSGDEMVIRLKTSRTPRLRYWLALARLRVVTCREFAIKTCEMVRERLR